MNPDLRIQFEIFLKWVYGIVMASGKILQRKEFKREEALKKDFKASLDSKLWYIGSVRSHFTNLVPHLGPL